MCPCGVCLEDFSVDVCCGIVAFTVVGFDGTAEYIPGYAQHAVDLVSRIKTLLHAAEVHNERQ